MTLPISSSPSLVVVSSTSPTAGPPASRFFQPTAPGRPLGRRLGHGPRRRATRSVGLRTPNSLRAGASDYEFGRQELTWSDLVTGSRSRSAGRRTRLWLPRWGLRSAWLHSAAIASIARPPPERRSPGLSAPQPPLSPA